MNPGSGGPIPVSRGRTGEWLSRVPFLGACGLMLLLSLPASVANIRASL